MLRNILVAFFLIGSAFAMHLEYLKFDTEEHLDGTLISAISNGSVGHDEDLLIPEEQLPGVCWACKWVITKVKKHLGSRENAEKIKEKLKKGCNKIGLLKDLCRKMVDKNIDMLVEELSTDDDPETICVNTGLCKKVESMLELIQVLPLNLQKL